MKKPHPLFLFLILLASVCFGQSTQTTIQPERNPDTRALETLFSIVEKNIVSAARGNQTAIENNQIAAT